MRFWPRRTTPTRRAPDREGSRRAFFAIEPEIPGAIVSSRQPGGEFVFDGWLGDDLVRVHPSILVTPALAAALERLPDPAGFAVTTAEVRASAFFTDHNPGLRLPEFRAVLAFGVPGRSDMGLTLDGTLVVSRRVLDVLLDFRIGRAVLAQYPGAR